MLLIRSISTCKSSYGDFLNNEKIKDVKLKNGKRSMGGGKGKKYKTESNGHQC